MTTSRCGAGKSKREEGVGGLARDGFVHWRAGGRWGWDRKSGGEPPHSKGMVIHCWGEETWRDEEGEDDDADGDSDEDAGEGEDCVGAGGGGAIWGGVRGGVAAEGGARDCEAGAVF